MSQHPSDAASPARPEPAALFAEYVDSLSDDTERREATRRARAVQLALLLGCIGLAALLGEVGLAPELRVVAVLAFVLAGGYLAQRLRPIPVFAPRCPVCDSNLEIRVTSQRALTATCGACRLTATTKETNIPWLRYS